MRRFLLDSGIASDFINRRHGVFERARSEAARGNRVGIGVPVLAELAAGIERSSSRDQNLERLRRAMPALRLWPFDEDAAFEYGRIYAELLALGRPMQVVDIDDRRHRLHPRELHHRIEGQRSFGRPTSRCGELG